MSHFSKILVLIFITFNSIAFASVEESQGTTTCYILKNDKLVQKSACHYSAQVDWSMPNTMSEYSYTVPHYGKIETVNNYSDGTNDNKNKGRVTFKTEVHTVNGKPSTNFQRNPITLKIYSKKALAKNNNLFKTSLYCNRTKDKKLEICTPDKGND